MKCENCGINEVNFYYTSNVNGKVTKKQLCSECAEKLGFTSNVGSMFQRQESMLSEMFGNFFGSPMSLSPFGGFGFGMPSLMAPEFGEEAVEEPRETQQGTCPNCGGTGKTVPNADPELVKRRELNVLKEQMRQAAANEEFEKAAEIRDRIRKMEE